MAGCKLTTPVALIQIYSLSRQTEVQLLMMIIVVVVCFLISLANAFRSDISFTKSYLANHANQAVLVPQSISFARPATPEAKSDDIDIFGSEFATVSNSQRKLLSEKNSKAQALKAYSKARSTVLADSILISALGFSLTWYIGSLQDASSFALGSFFGICYSILLGRYVEKIGTNQKNRFSDALRFAPVVILIALYGKFKLYISIIPELMGFFASYQLASLLQIFNDNLYNIEDEKV